MESHIGNAVVGTNGIHFLLEADAPLVRKYGKIRNVSNMPVVAKNGRHI